MKKEIVSNLGLFMFMIILPALVFASKPPDDAQKAKILNKSHRMSVPFIENRGQIENNEVSFYAKTFGGTLFVEKNGTLTYSLPFEDKGGVVIKEIFTDKKIKVKGLDPSSTKANYFKGKDKSKWRSNIPSYETISLREVYKGVELTLRAYGNNVEKIFTVLPKGNPEAIKIKLQGAKKLKVNEKGELELSTEKGPLTFTRPLAYQEINGKKKEVEVSYKLINSKLINSPIPESHNSKHPESCVLSSSTLTYGFKVGNYDKRRSLIIDPLFIGGDDSDRAYAITLDGSGNIYVTGVTDSSDYPTTSGAYNEVHNGGDDVFISKLDSSLSSLLVSTFIGGSNDDWGHSIVLDGSGNIYVTGVTDSSDYPTTSGAYNEVHNGGYDVFISKLDSSLSSLLASTFIGGSSPSADDAKSIVLDGSGNVYVTGRTWSSDYPTTSGAYDESYNWGRDGFISKLDSSLSSLLSSTFIGGSNDDWGHSIVLDGSSNVYVTGGTSSTDYPTTSGAYNEVHSGDDDVFISKLDSSLISLLESTFIGGNDFDWGHSIAYESGNVSIAGKTNSTDYPTTSGAYDESYNGGIDGFISTLDSSLSSLLASTFIGGSGDESDEGNPYWFWAPSLALDESGNTYLTGVTDSSDYPIIPGAYNEVHNGGDDVFISKLDGSLSTLLASTFIGDSGDDYGNAIILDQGFVYVTGEMSSNGNSDVFVSRFDRTLSIADEKYWAKTYGGSDAEGLLPLAHNHIQQTTDGGYIVAGNTSSFGAGEYDFWILKLDRSGDVSWQKTYGMTEAEIVNSIQQTTDGGYIVAGWTEFSTNNYIIWVLKLDSSGTISWQKIYGGSEYDFAHSIQQTTDGGYIVIGSTNSFGAGENDLWILKLDSSGNVSWQKTYGGSGSEGSIINSLFSIQTLDGGYIVACDTASFGAGVMDFWVLKLDSSGNVSWQKTYGGSDDDFARSIQQTSGGGYVIAGYTTSFGAGGMDFWVLKLDSSGNVSWQKTYGGISNDDAHSIQPTTDGGYIVAGYTWSFGAGEKDVWLLKLNSNGEISDEKTFGGGTREEANSIRQTKDGGYIVAGSTNSFGAGESDLWVLKLDSGGEIPNCDILGTSSAVVNDTYVSGENTNATVQSSTGFPFNTFATPVSTSAEISVICCYDSFYYDYDCDSVLDDGDLSGNPGDNPCAGGQTENCDDNCPDVANPNQESSDEDELGDMCDNCPLDTNPGQEDNDTDALGNVCDNCPDTPNPLQEDTYPPDGNNIGDACDCEADFTCDGDVDADDVTAFLVDFGREEYYLPCTNGDPCNGDFDCDGDVDADDVTLFLEDFGREQYYNPCPACTPGAWCTYP